MFACIRPGDCVWDVGANVGLYSELFAATVGPAGKVVSLSPLQIASQSSRKDVEAAPLAPRGR